ncbi:MAG: HEPN domain-containing protein [Methylorubrum populi]
MTAVVLDLHYVDELIDQRRKQHGGYQGAPPIINGYRQGESINRSCMVMMSALLQAYIEDVFVECSKSVMPNLSNGIGKYKNSFSRWGNPSPENINNLFLRLGVEKVLDGLKWQRTPDTIVAAKLRVMNELRNKIAHGDKTLIVSGKSVSLSLSIVENYRSFCAVFAQKFEGHAKNKVLII